MVRWLTETCRVLLSFRTQHIHFNALSFNCDLCSVFNECAWVCDKDECSKHARRKDKDGLITRNEGFSYTCYRCVVFWVWRSVHNNFFVFWDIKYISLSNIVTFLSIACYITDVELLQLVILRDFKQASAAV